MGLTTIEKTGIYYKVLKNKYDPYVFISKFKK